MQALLVFILVIGGVVGFMYLLLKVCMLTSGSGKKDKAIVAAPVPAKADSARGH